MTKKPTVSFVIRTKNEGPHIGRVLKFLMKQTYQDFEIIVIDSGSADNTLKIIKKYPVRLIKIKPGKFGYSSTLNMGIKKSRGKYVAIISAHSLPVSDKWLEDGVRIIKQSGVAGLSGYYTGVPIGYLSRQFGKLFFSPSDLKRMDYDPWMTNTNSLIKKERWEEYHFDEKLDKIGCEDYDWALEMLSRSYSIVKAPGFNVFHSHFLLGKPGYLQRLPEWKKTCKVLEQKKRPSRGI